jgi:hypothetical protein
MAIKNILAGGLGFFSGSGKWIVTAGFSSRDLVVSSGPNMLQGSHSDLGVPQGSQLDLEVLSTGEHSELN